MLINTVNQLQDRSAATFAGELLVVGAHIPCPQQHGHGAQPLDGGFVADAAAVEALGWQNYVVCGEVAGHGQDGLGVWGGAGEHWEGQGGGVAARGSRSTGLREVLQRLLAEI